MKFQKGQPRHPNAGRKVGTSNKSNIQKMSDFLKENNINPSKQMVDLIPDLSPEKQFDAWALIFSLCHAKPKDENISDGNSREQDLLILFKDVTDEALFQIVANEKTEVS